MKKLMTVILLSLCMLSLVACQKISESEVYSFPELTKKITVIFHSQGQETTFEFGEENNDYNNGEINSLIKWFYGLELIDCEVPEVVYGAENYVFEVNGKDAFTYEDRGKDAYIIIGGDYYKVNNPSTPPIN